MLTPDFKLSQADTHVVVVLRLPYVKISACEFYIQEHHFKFYLKPYLLSLEFEQALKQVQEPMKAVYYNEKYLLEVHLEKKNKGEFFQKLDLMTNVLRKNKKEGSKPKRQLVEVVEAESTVVEHEQDKAVRSNPYSYGFCHSYNNVFNNLEEEVYELFFFNPEQVARGDRFQLSRQIANQYFDQDAFQYDQEQNRQQIESLICNLETQKTLQALLCAEPRALPKKQLLVAASACAPVLKQALGLCFCYLYELLCMGGELSVESAKTISSSCAVLSCCVDYEQLDLVKVIVDCARRCVIYSLYKSVSLCQRVVTIMQEKLTVELLVAIIGQLRAAFEKSEPRYLLNTIYLDDLMVFCAKAKIQEEFQRAMADIKGLKIAKEDLDLQINQDIDDDEQQELQQQVVKQAKPCLQEPSYTSELPDMSKKSPLVIELSSEVAEPAPEP